MTDERAGKKAAQRLEKIPASPSWERSPHDDGVVSPLRVATFFLRSRRLIGGLAAVGAAIGLAIGLLSTRLYVSTAVFLPQATDATPSSLASAASQFGIRVTSGGSVWGPPIYVELLRSRALLEPIVLDTVVVAEEGRRRAAVVDLLGIKVPPSERRTDLAVRSLATWVASSELREFSAVRLSVKTRWPSVSLALADKLLRGVNQFNLQTRKSQAVAERQFVEAQAADAEMTLRDAENRLLTFLQRNRAIGSPELTFEQDRLQREVGRRQQLYTSLLQNREEARIREVRDIPVITAIESPVLATLPEPRRSVFKGIMGALLGAAIGVLISLLSQTLKLARESSGEANEFLRLLEDATPRFLRRRKG